MHDIWAFLLQTLTLSLVALFLLILKTIFQNKLSPRWQYGVWLVLALRALIPAGVSGQMLLPLDRWVERLRLLAETHLSSAYTGVWSNTRVLSPIPWPAAAPQSITDWLFCLYAAGVVFTLLWFLISYLRLRRTLSPAPERREQAERVARQYGLPIPKVAEGPVPSAFVCSPLRPTLVLPRGAQVDDKVVLHELLHLKYGDLWLNLLSCLLRCLHWCNPFLWKVFDRVGNDAEALCDQRVLERLAGEERRDYGRILLSMADDRYTRLPGTTSMANGGRNIKARIQSIARFKRYPAGMTLVSLCIVAILLPACLTGTGAAAQLPAVPDREARAQLEPEKLRAALLRDFALARACRPATVAGALDCYAKAVVNNNAYYLAAVSDVEKQQELYETLLARNGETWELGNYYLDMGVFREAQAPADWPRTAGSLSPYLVLNLREEGAGYTAVVLFPYQTADEESYPVLNVVAHEVALTQADGGWLVALTRTHSCHALPTNVYFYNDPAAMPLLCGLDSYYTGTASCQDYQAAFYVQRICTPSQDTLTGQGYDHMICGFGSTLLSAPDLDAQFETDVLTGIFELQLGSNPPDPDFESLHSRFQFFDSGDHCYYSGDVPLLSRSLLFGRDGDTFYTQSFQISEPGRTAARCTIQPSLGGRSLPELSFDLTEVIS